MFDTVSNFFKRMVGSTAAKTAANVAKTVASKVSSASKTEIGKTAIEAGKSVVKEVGLKAIDVGKDVAIAKAKALIDGYNAPKNHEVTQESRDALASLVNMGSIKETNINNLLAGYGIGVKKGVARANAISIQDLVKRLNTGSGLRLA
ncbi:hypothetical protein DPMN_064633 [Dreissena polymorpha]|uniref:Uncharacterized protein n=1 Tax=Dreissena polymorpha TaxID=45954 RepID=A0A9D4HMB6_DREPO|nr:hypothetical protein DPMN_058999 [Dreissena polymorpha]KAH3721686.1 hypothetical protein DPMN_064633 [Dreissena polymorpha]